MTKRLFVTISLLMAFLGIRALEATLVPHVTASSDVGIAVINNNDVYIDTQSILTMDAGLSQITGTTVSITITVSKGDKNNFLQFNNLEITQSSAHITGIDLTSNESFSDYFREAGIVSVSASYVITVNDNKGEVQSFTNELIVHVYAPCSFNDVADSQEMVVGYSQNSVTFSASSANIKGGNSNGWRYRWCYGDSYIDGATGSSYTILGSDVSLNQGGNYSVEISNYADDGTLLLGVHSVNGYNLTVYSPVTLNMVNESGLSEIVSGYKDNVHFRLDREGGPSDGWTYVWYKDDIQLPFTGTTCDYQPQAPSGNSQTDYIHVVVQCIKNDKIIYSNEEVGYNLTVYSPVTLNMVNESGLSEIVSGYKDNVHFRLDREGGPSDGWTYTWYEDNSKLLSTGTTCDYKPDAPSDSLKTHNICVVVQCTRNGKTIFSNEEITDNPRSIPITVYHAASIEVYGLESLLADAGRRELLNGDTYQLVIRKKGGIGKIDDGNYWKIEWSDPQSQGSFIPDSYVKTFTAVNTQSPNVGTAVEAKQYSHVVKVSNIVNGKEVFSATSNPLDVFVYPAFSIVESIKDTIRTCPNSNQPITVRSNVWGGNPFGWTYEWKRNGELLNKENNPSLSSSSFSNDTDMPVDVIYTLYATNKIGSRLCYEEKDTFIVKVWPAIRYEVSYKSSTGESGIIDGNTLIPLYVGDKIEYELSFVGGNPEGWQAIWSPSEHVNTLNPDNKHFSVVPVSKNTTGPYEESSNLKLVNTFNKETWLDIQIQLPYRVFNRGYIDKDIQIDSLDIYVQGKDNLQLKVITHEGNTETNAWKYKWINSLYGEETNYSNVQKVIVPQVGTYTEMICKTVCTNSIHDYVGSTDETNPLIIRLWPAASFGDINAVKYIRNGESARFYSAVSGAYTPNGSADWQYDWYLDNQLVESNHDGVWSYEVNADFRGEGMDMSHQDFHLQVTNYGPYGKMWANKSYDMPVTIYKQPRTPIKLERKGNGKSNTFVITFPNGITDEVLTTNEYQYVFGYTDANGKDHDLATLNTRYYHMDNASDYNDKTRKYYVYALWTYPDGARVTSNKRILDSAEEHFDGSNFEQITRADASSISSLLSERIEINGNHFDAHFDKSVKVAVTIYSIRGNVIREHVLDAKNDYHEIISLSGLSSGVYLMKYTYDNQVKVEKVVVK